MSHLSVTAIGADRPGIVAALTGALYELDCNLEDVSSTILRGSFSIMLVVRVPDGTDADTVRSRLEAAMAELGVSVTVRPAPETAGGPVVSTHSLVVYGSDRTGIVAGLTEVLARRGVNVVDLSCRLVGEDDPVYAMAAEIAIPPDDATNVEREIEETAARLGVDVTLRRVEVETL